MRRRLNEALAKQIAEELNTEWAPNLDTILGRGDIDCVMMMTPSGTHAALGIRVAQAGKHVITTKPMDVLPKPVIASSPPATRQASS